MKTSAFVVPNRFEVDSNPGFLQMITSGLHLLQSKKSCLLIASIELENEIYSGPAFLSQ